MANRALGILAVAALGLALAGCDGGPATSIGTAGSAGPVASLPATGGTSSTAAVPASPTRPAPPTGTGAPAPATGSGITGVTMIDGGCPVVRVDSPCPDRPFQARLTVTDAASGTVVAATDTDPSGRFRLPLPPGQYQVRAANRNGAALPRAAPVTATVASGRYTTVTIRFDSGIR
jgi:hypothetical protein